MGVDATLFVIANYSGYGVGYVTCSFDLNRDRDLWGPLEQMQRRDKHRTWAQVQVPQGSHSTYRGGEVPTGFEDRESGYLRDDCYGNKLDAFKGRLLAGVKREEDGRFPGDVPPLNQAVFDFVATHFPEHDVVVYWH